MARGFGKPRRVQAGGKRGGRPFEPKPRSQDGGYNPNDGGPLGKLAQKIVASQSSQANPGMKLGIRRTGKANTGNSFGQGNSPRNIIGSTIAGVKVTGVNKGRGPSLPGLGTRKPMMTPPGGRPFGTGPSVGPGDLGPTQGIAPIRDHIFPRPAIRLANPGAQGMSMGKPMPYLPGHAGFRKALKMGIRRGR